MIPITPPELWAFSAHTDRQAQLILDLGMEFSVVKNGLGQVTDEYVIAIENLNKWLEENDLVGYRRRRSPEHRTFTIIRAGNPNISFVRRGTWCVDILTKEYDQMLRGDAISSFCFPSDLQAPIRESNPVITTIIGALLRLAN